MTSPTCRRENRRRDSVAMWWTLFENIQKALRDGAGKTLTGLEQEKYFISVTHDEVNRGLLRNAKAELQSIYFDRVIVGIDEALASDYLASSFKDAVWGNTLPRVKDEEVEKLHGQE